MTPHSETSASGLGLISAVAETIADPQVRNRGTIGGSIVHGDPASDLPAALLAAEATVTLRSSSGERSLPAAELFVDYLTTNVGPEEVMTSIDMPSLDGWGFSYQKFNRRAEDWAMVAVPVLVKASGGVCEDVRIGLTNMGNRPLRATAAEEALRGKPLDAASIEAASKLADEGVFFYESRRFLDTGDERDRLMGNAPILVCCSGDVHLLGTTLPVEQYIENFRVSGDPYGGLASELGA
jgi:carbon-monoxide dehydrogenase medium subunit